MAACVIITCSIPPTAMPVQNELASVTIISRTPHRPDALSTACFVLGMQEGMVLIEAMDGTEALFIRRDGTTAATSGWPAA